MSDASAILFVMSLKITKSALLLIKDFLCSFNQKMPLLNVVQNGLKSLYTKFGSDWWCGTKWYQNGTKLGMAHFFAILYNFFL